jgi:ABC-type multidrug transport system fused ATPase/permease subunit
LHFARLRVEEQLVDTAPAPVFTRTQALAVRHGADHDRALDPVSPLNLCRFTQLVIRDLSQTYPNGTRALKDISLDIPKGMFGLLGRNGAGKSTLMRIIATLQEPDEGSIRLGDIDVLRQKGEVRKTLGYLPQSFGFHPKVSAERPPLRRWAT